MRAPASVAPFAVAPIDRSGPFRAADFASHAASADARFVADWVADSGDSRGLPYLILDKRDARLFVFAADGRLIDSSPVLLGAAPGDDSVAGIGTRPMDQRPRTKRRPLPPAASSPRPGGTPPARKSSGSTTHAAVSMHRVRLVDPKERRLERLASPDPASGASRTAASTSRSRSSIGRLAAARARPGR